MAKLLNFIRKNYLSLILISLIGLIMCINMYDLKYAACTNLKTVFAIYFILLILAGICFLVIEKKDFNEKHIPKIFLILSIILGSIYVFSAPLFTGSDEHNHYYRIYEITEGHFITPTDKYVGSELPSSLQKTFIAGGTNNQVIKYDNIKDMLNVKLNKLDKSQYGNGGYGNDYSNTALYSPVQYLPQTIGFSLGKIFNLSPYMIGILGRIFNLLFFAIMGYLALKIIPKAKMFLMLILLSPNMLQCASTLSADAFTNVSLLLFISIILQNIFTKQKITRLKEACLLILAIVLTLCKIVYLPLVFILLLIPKENYTGNKKEKWIFSILTLVISIIVGMLWMNSTDKIFEIAFQKTDIQKEFIFGHVFEYFIILVRTFFVHGFKYFECFLVGTTMYHTQINMPILLSLFYNFIAFISLYNDEVTNKLNNVSRIALSIIAVVVIGLVCTAIYIQCTANFYGVGYQTVEGIQGRYFVPILFLIPFIFKIKKKINIKNNICILATLFINISTWIYMIARFTI